MAYENEISQEFIKKRMIDSVTADIDTREGSFTYDALSPVANEVSLIYFELQRILEKCFVETSYGNFLDKRAAEFGLIRKVGTSAIGQVTFTGGTGLTIPANSIVRTPDGLKYTTNKDVIINNGTVIADITAIEIGDKYNIPANTIIETDAKGNITYVTNVNAITGGTDNESDAAFRARIIQRMQNPPGSGNKADYERWAKEIDGVYYAKIVPLWNGPGTVKVVIGGENGQPVLVETLTETQNYIDPTNGSGDGKAPVGATVTVVNVTPITANIKITGLTIETGYSLDSVKANIKTALEQYTDTLEPGQSIRYNEIISTVIDAKGVADFTSIAVNDATSNITITGEQKSILGTITYV